jgi:beta-phosphoglucomutase family hydrolase
MSRPAVLFDLDGVISDTVSVHAKAWRMVFNDALAHHGLADQVFDERVDYRLHVDGKSRQAGIEDFLLSRNVVLPLGESDQTGFDTVNGIGNTKNAIFRDLIARDGVAIFDDARRLIAKLRSEKFELGLASSSKNARIVLEKCGLLGSFKAIMDGLVAEREGVSSKPSPDFYRHAAALVGSEPRECIVIEDATSGIVSAKQAGVMSVIGIARADNAVSLQQSGADVVVTSLDDLPFDIFPVGGRP